MKNKNDNNNNHKKRNKKVITLITLSIIKQVVTII